MKEEYLRKLIVWYAVVPLKRLPYDERKLVLEGRRATHQSHSPYSRFRVGAAVKLVDRTVITGANQENASYGLTVCAERTTIFSANNLGRKKDIVKLACTARKAFDVDGNPIAENDYCAEPSLSCGACRQVIKEAEDLHGSPMILLFDAYNDEKILRFNGVESILPWGFSGKDFGMDLNG